MEKGLEQYIIEGRAMEDLMNQQTETFALNESGEEVAPVKRFQEPNALRKFLVESILAECSTGVVGTTGYGSQKPSDPKIEKTRAMVSVIQDMAWKMDRNTYSDEDVSKVMQDSFTPIIKAMVQKLYNIWCIDASDKPAETPAPAPLEGTPAASPVPAGAPVEAGGMELTFVQGESLTSPQNKKYIIEEVGVAQLKVKDVATGAKATVSIDIAKKWKNRK